MTKSKKMLCDKAAKQLLNEVAQYENAGLERNFADVLSHMPTKHLELFVLLLNMIPAPENDHA